MNKAFQFKGMRTASLFQFDIKHKKQPDLTSNKYDEKVQTLHR